MTEHNLQQLIRIELSKYGIVLRLNNGRFKTEDGRIISSGLPNGVSDLLFIGNGFVAWIEVKTDKGKPTKEQLNWIDMMNSMGHRAAVVRSVDEAVKLIQNNSK